MSLSALEAPIDAILDSAMGEGVRGVIIVDSQGLCVAVRGAASAEASGLILSIAKQAQELSGASDTQDSQVVTEVKTGSGVIYVREDGAYVTAIYK